MPLTTDAASAPLYIIRAKGANRIRHMGASRISEAFDKNAAPAVGAICVVVQDAEDSYDLDDLDDEQFAESDVIIALAVVRGMAGIASGAVRATLSPIHNLSTPVSLGSLRNDLSGLGVMPDAFYSRRLGSEIASALLGELINLDHSVADWLERVLVEPRTFPSQVEQSRAEAKDAVKLAAQIAKIDLPADAFLTAPTDIDDETLLQTILNSAYELDNEEELLPLDLQRFDGKLAGQQRAASTSVFTDKWGREKLCVMSVNKKPIELELGVDLLYWDKIHDSFTFIQYKRLEKVASHRPAGGNDWAYMRKGEIKKQLELMPIGKFSSEKANDWRAFATPFWFKFVRGDAGSQLDDKALKGMYIPADWLRLAIKGDTLKSGPKRGFRVTYDNAKYLGRSAFTELVSRGFIGTAGERSKAFKKVLDKSKDRELIIAIREAWQNDEESHDTANAFEELIGVRMEEPTTDSAFLGHRSELNLPRTQTT